MNDGDLSEQLDGFATILKNEGEPYKSAMLRRAARQLRRQVPDVYARFIEEVDALTIKADDSATAVVGVLTRAVKRAQMVHDGELKPIAERMPR